MQQLNCCITCCVFFMDGLTPLESEAVEAQIYPIRKVAPRTRRCASRCHECETLKRADVYSL